MNNKRQMIPAVGLLATFVAAVYMVVQLRAQTTSPTGDFTKATLAEVRDAQGQVILSGQFQLAEEDDDDVERKAALGPTGVVPMPLAKRKSSSARLLGRAGNRFLGGECAGWCRVDVRD